MLKIFNSKPALVIVVILLLTACEKTEKVDNFPKHQSKLVTNCLFGAGQGFQFKLFKSLSPIDNAPFKELTNAKAYIKIYEDNVLFDSLTYHATLTSSFFRGDSNKTSSRNHSYRFECYYPGFDMVSGEDYLPDSASVQKIKGYYTVLNSYYSNDTMITGNFATNMNIDLSSSEQYLILTIEKYSLNRYGSGSYMYDLSDLNTGNESDFINNNLYVHNSAGVKAINLKWTGDYDNIFKNKPSFKYWIVIYSCSAATFDYLRRQALQTENNDDPFSQPTPISNNIRNGYGIFGGISAIQRITSF